MIKMRNFDFENGSTALKWFVFSLYLSKSVWHLNTLIDEFKGKGTAKLQAVKRQKRKGRFLAGELCA